MVSLVTAVLACTMGLMVYTIVPVLAITAPVHLRQRVGAFYLKNGAKILKQFAFIRRTLSGYDILPINVDNEQKLLKLTLSGSRISDDEEYRFNDPDNRISRLFNKPVALAFELIPAAIDAELSEWGYWTKEKMVEDGLQYREEGEQVQDYADPYVPADDGLRLVDPIEAFNIVGKDVDPENILTAEKFTKERKALFDRGVGLAESMRIILGFGVGVGGVIALNYVQTELLDGAAPTPPVVGNETLSVVPWDVVLDAAVVVV